MPEINLIGMIHLGMKTIVQNLAIEYQDTGVGPVMLFLHGWQDDLHTFDALLPLLPATRRMIRVDLPGFGVSEKPKESWDLDDYARFVRDFVQKLDVPVDVLIGHSFGGRIAIKAGAEKYLESRKIILIASAGVAKRNTMGAAMIRMAAKAGKIVISIPPLIFWKEKLKARFYRSIGSDYANAGALKGTFLKIIAEDLSTSAQKIQTPTLLIWGSRDRETPLSEGQRLAQLISRSDLKVIEGAGHFVHREKPQEVAEFIQKTY